MCIHICSDRWMCVCANTDTGAPEGECFSHFCNISACVRASGFKQNSSPGPRPLESSACEGQVWFRKRQGRLAWKWNLLSLCQTSRLTDCPQPLITSKSIVSPLPSTPPFPGGRLCIPISEKHVGEASLRRACLIIEMSNNTSMKRKHESSCW